MSELTTNSIKALFLEAAGGIENHVIGAEQLANTMTCLLMLFRDKLQVTPKPFEQMYGSVTQLATRYGKSVNTLKVWARQLEAEGLINPLEGAPEREGARGDTIYSFEEFDAALRERRKAKINNPSVSA